MTKPFALTPHQIKKNVELASHWCQKIGVDALYISSFDPFLNEYVPLEDCHRYYFTGFKGSVSECLLMASGKVTLFVDGRYHEQADLECDSSYVTVEKCTYGVSLQTALKEKIKNLGLLQIAIEGVRTPLAFKHELEQLVAIKNVFETDFPAEIEFKKPPCLGTIKTIADSLCGASCQEKLAKILDGHSGIFLSALDSIAWLANARGYQLAYQSTFRAKAFATKESLSLFIEDETFIDESSFINHPVIKVIKTSFSHLDKALKKLKADFPELEKIEYESAKTSAFDYDVLSKAFGADKLKDRPKGILSFHAQKNPTELEQMALSFQKADKAIKKTIAWTKNEVQSGRSPSELEFYNMANNFYKEGGAISQSFKTIASTGPNSSIIHYTSSSDQVFIQKGELVLLDSGAYYEAGLATDCTRTFLAGGTARPELKKIYTLVLKGLLGAQNAVFPIGTHGSCIDGLARAPLLRHGYDYAHGTGHGVGVNVHEGDFSITPISKVPLYENLVGSLEPGIYIPGMGGVRLENIVCVEKHPRFENLLCFRPLSYVAFDHDLIDNSLLNEEERTWLQTYEEECLKRT